MNLLYKIATYVSGPILALGLAGCESAFEPNDKPVTTLKIETTKDGQIKFASQKPDFKKHYIGKISTGVNYTDDIQTRVADFDGDGDLDFLVVNAVGKMYWFENSIPQKPKKK